MLEVTIAELPKKLSIFDAVDSCYMEQIRFIVARVRENISVLIRCEKQIIPYLQGILKKRLTSEGKNVSIIDGRAESSQGMQTTRVMGIVNQLRGLVNNTEANKVFFLPYLDIITSTVAGGLSQESKEIMTVIHENPLLVMVAFEDPDFPLPELISQAFPARTELLGIPRTRLSGLITCEEAKKFAADRINLMPIFKFVSGLNPVRFREIMGIFSHKADFNPAMTDQLTNYMKELRDYTACGGAALSTIHLEKDIAGYAKVKTQIRENILNLLLATAHLADEKQIRKLESIIPRGIIFYGPPGTGKTLFAKGIAESLNAAIYIISGPELKSKWVGEGEANIRRLFARARATAPSVIVFDELDSIASARTGGSDGASQASHSMVNQLLTEMDGFRKEQMVLIIGTTNFPQSLDQAFLRPGRFEYQIEIPYPDWDDRRAILHLYNSVYETGVTVEDLDMLAGWTGRMTDTGTPYAGDHLSALMKQLKRQLINGRREKADPEFLGTWLKELAGIARLEAADEQVVAVHECGHALMYCKYGRLEEIKKVTLESGSSSALGMVQAESKKPNYMYTEARLRGEIGILLGGYCAEKLMYGEVSTGASQDLKIASAIALDMVGRYGMGKDGVPRSFVNDADRIDPYFTAALSPRLDAVLGEVREEVLNFLDLHRPYLEAMTQALIQRRTLGMTDIAALLAGEETPGSGG
jgi:cell division protease FtsH